jgi:hypothetical protein
VKNAVDYGGNIIMINTTKCLTTLLNARSAIESLKVTAKRTESFAPTAAI